MMNKAVESTRNEGKSAALVIKVVSITQFAAAYIETVTASLHEQTGE